MNYQIKVANMHCTSCSSLIKMTLEDSFDNIKVDLNTKLVEFQSSEKLPDVAKELDKQFIELKETGYEYTDLKVLN